MNADKMWQTFKDKNNIADSVKYDAWQFGAEPDTLARLVLEGTKTATASAYPLYEVENEGLPEEGAYSIILNSSDEQVCVIQITDVYVVPFSEVSAEHAYKEGEGDRSLQYWRDMHEEVFKKWLGEAGISFDMKTKVVCEEFKVVFQ